MPMPQRGPCTSTPIIYKVLPLALLALLLHQHLLTVQHEHSNKRLYQHAIPIPSIEYYLYTRHGGSGELAPPMALRRLRPVREKEKRKAIFQCSQVASVPKRVGAARQDLRAYNWFITRLRKVKNQAEDQGHIQDRLCKP